MRSFIFIVIVLISSFVSEAQMRRTYVDQNENNWIKKIDFYSPSQGYVAFTYWIGFTTDSGKTFQKKYIDLNNVDYNGYFPNLTFGFGINGIKAFDQNHLVVYGDYGFMPSTLYSSDGGNTFKLIYYHNYGVEHLTDGVKDMIFPQDAFTGFAIEENLLLKTVDGGRTWSVAKQDAGAMYERITGLDNNNLFLSESRPTPGYLRTTNGGSSWQSFSLPGGISGAPFFLTPQMGWMEDATGKWYFTSDGGSSWKIMNTDYSLFKGGDAHFINDSTGYALGDEYNVYKTSDSGKVWERLPRQDYQYTGFSHFDLFFWNNTQFWAGGYHGLLEMSTNGGGTPLPKAYFRFDTTGVYSTGTVNLVNLSKPNHQFKWYKNDVLIGTSYNASYTHNINDYLDIIKLVAIDSSGTDTLTIGQYFNIPPPPPPPLVGWVQKATNINDNLLDIRFMGNKGVIIGDNGIYYTRTGSEDPNGWTKYQISNPADNALLSSMKWKRMTTWGSSSNFYICGTDTVNKKAVLFKLNLDDLSYAFLYQGTTGSSFNDITTENSLLYLVGDNGLFAIYNVGDNTHAESRFADAKDLVSISMISRPNNHQTISIFSDSTVYVGYYSGGPNLFTPDFTSPLKQKIISGAPEVTAFAGISSGKLYEYSVSLPKFFIDSVQRVVPAGAVFHSVATIGNEVFIASDRGIYRQSRQEFSTLEYQPTSGGKDINRIWFMTFDTAYAVGRNGVLMKTSNYGGPTVPYSEILNTGNCFGDPVTLYGLHGSGSSCRWFIDEQFITDNCNKPVTSIGTPGTHNLKLIVSNGYGLADTSRRNIYVTPPPVTNLPVTISKQILCKSEPVTVLIKSTQPGFYYELFDSTGKSYGGINSSNGGQIVFNTSAISTTGNYFIRVNALVGGCARDFSDKIFIKVEHTKSSFNADKINITPGEPVNFYNHSIEAASYDWQFTGATTTTSTLPYPKNISYTSPGVKTVTLMSISANGCVDTTITSILAVYNKPVPDDACYVENVDSVQVATHGYGHMAKASDDGYFISGTNYQKLRSRYGINFSLPAIATSFIGRYTTDGVLKWVNYVTSGSITTSTSDTDGNVYIGGYCNVLNWFHFNNGDSIKISATASDTTLYLGRYNGFIVKLDSNGKYLWHIILPYMSPTSENSWGGVLQKLLWKNGSLVAVGSFLDKLSYYRNGISQILFSLAPTGYNNDQENTFLLRINTDGSLAWSSYAHNDAVNYLYAFSDVDCDASGNVYLTGYHERLVTITDAAGTTVNLSGATGTTHGYLLKYDPNGHFQWNIHLDNNNTNSKEVKLNAIATDSLGNSYVTGSCSGLDPSTFFTLKNSDGTITNLSFSPYFLLKVGTDGKYRWGSGTKYAGGGGGSTVTIKGNHVYTTGKASNYNKDSTQFAMPSSDGSFINMPIYSKEFFIAKYDTSGILKSLAKSGNSNGEVNAGALFFDSKEHAVIGGSMSRFSSATVLNHTFVSDDIFFAKLNADYCLTPSGIKADAGPDKITCSGGAVSIGNTSNALSYSWTSNPIGFVSSLANPTVSPNVTTTYYLSVLASDGSISKDTVTVTVNGPIASAGSDRSICSGTSTAIGATAEAGNTYSWISVPAGFSSSAATVTVSPTASTAYYLTVTNASSSCVARDTLSVTVNQPPPKSAGPDKSICSGTSGVTIGSINVPVFTYSWSPSTGLTAPNSSQPFANPSSTTSYILTVTNNQTGCTSLDTVVVNVVQNLAKPQVTSQGTSICNGSSLALTSSAASGNQWYKDGVIINGATGSTYAATVSGSYTVKYSYGGCISDFSSPVVLTVTQTIAAPAISYSGNARFCQGQSLTLSSSAASGNQWYKNGTIITGATAQTYLVIGSGNYAVSIIQNSCSSPLSSPVAVTVNPLPVAPVVSLNGNILTSSASSGNQWYLNGNIIPGAVGSSYTAATSGDYAVAVSTNGCSGPLSTAVTVTITAINPPSFSKDILIAPNPVKDKLKVWYTGTGANFHLYLMDITGKNILKNLTFTSTAEIDMSQYTNGVYLIKIVNSKGEQFVRIISKL